jgi:hypothetical protein
VDWGLRKGPPKMRIGRTTIGYLRLFAARSQIVAGRRRL